MLKSEKLKVGLQVAYIPSHVREQCAGVIWKMKKHPDTEFGFVSSWRSEDGIEETVFCRFWSRTHPYILRTLSTSEACDSLDLEICDTRSAVQMDEILTTLRSERRR